MRLLAILLGILLEQLLRRASVRWWGPSLFAVVVLFASRVDAAAFFLSWDYYPLDSSENIMRNYVSGPSYDIPGNIPRPGQQGGAAAAVTEGGDYVGVLSVYNPATVNGVMGSYAGEIIFSTQHDAVGRYWVTLSGLVSTTLYPTGRDGVSVAGVNFCWSTPNSGMVTGMRDPYHQYQRYAGDPCMSLQLQFLSDRPIGAATQPTTQPQPLDMPDDDDEDAANAKQQIQAKADALFGTKSGWAGKSSSASGADGDLLASFGAMGLSVPSTSGTIAIGGASIPFNPFKVFNFETMNETVNRFTVQVQNANNLFSSFSAVVRPISTLVFCAFWMVWCFKLVLQAMGIRQLEGPPISTGEMAGAIMRDNADGYVYEDPMEPDDGMYENQEKWSRPPEGGPH